VLRDLGPVLAKLNARPLPLGIFGAPGEGKTTLAAQLFAVVPDTAIFLNTQHEDVIGRLKGVWHGGTFPGVWKALRSWNRPSPPKIEWRPGGIQDEAEVYRGLKALFTWKYRTKDPRKVFIFVDEAHEFSEKDAWLEIIARKGRRWNLQPVVITQFPLALANRRILGALNNGWCLLFLDGSQWSSIAQSYRGLARPEWVETYTAPGSHRAVYYNHRAWAPLDGDRDAGGVADGRGVAPATEAPGGRDERRQTPVRGRVDARPPARRAPPQGVDSGRAAGGSSEGGGEV